MWTVWLVWSTVGGGGRRRKRGGEGGEVGCGQGGYFFRFLRVVNRVKKLVIEASRLLVSDASVTHTAQ